MMLYFGPELIRAFGVSARVDIDELLDFLQKRDYTFSVSDSVVEITSIEQLHELPAPQPTPAPTAPFDPTGP